MSSTVTYKGSTIASVSNTTKTLETAGKYMEDDVTITDVSQATPVLQTVSKSYTPTESAQSEDVTAGSGYDGLEKVSVSVGAISSSYVGSGITRRSSSDMSASGATVTAPAGYYENAGTKSVASGTVTAPASISGTSATVSTGTNTLTLSKTVSVTPSVTTAGYVSSGTAGNSSVSLTASVNTRSSSDLTASGATVTAPAGYYAASASKAVTSGSATAPSTISSTGATVSTSGTSTLTLSKSNVSVTPTVSAGYVSSGTAGNSTVSLSATVNIRTSSNLTASGDTVTAPAGYYASSASKAVSAGTAGTPTATKGTVSNHSVSVTPSVTNTTGYITGSTKTGTAVTVSASELDSGTKSISANGTGIDVVGYAAVDVNVSGTQAGTVYQDNDGYLVLDDGAGSSVQVDSLSVTTNGTYTASSGHAYSPVVVNVSGGGGAVEEKQINFIDYDGTILHSYTKAEINAMTQESELPANPSHTGLTAQGWNWTLAQIKAQLTAAPDGPVWVGQMYVTSSGKTEIDITLIDSCRLSPTLCICVNGTVSVDWGDNSTPDTVTGSSLTTYLMTAHTYAATGDYTIAISVTSGSFQFYCNNGGKTLLMFDSSSTSATKNVVYSGRVKAVRIGTGTTSIGQYAFYYCFNLEYVTIPSTITSIGAGAFDGCLVLNSATIPSGATITNSYVFEFSGVSIVSLPVTVSIKDYMFRNCHNLRSITITTASTSIGSYAFQYCESLKAAVIPTGMTVVYGNAFQYCYSLATLVLPSTLTSTNSYAFSDCRALSTVNIPALNGVGSYLFYNCQNLSSVTLQSGVKYVSQQEFNMCYGFASITIPDTVISIGASAFNSCYGLKEVHMLATTPPTGGASMFTNTASDFVLYVPYSADHSVLETYKTASNWSTYASYMQEEPQ